MKKLRRFNNFLGRQFKHTNHSLSRISIQPVKRFFIRVILLTLRHELELKSIKLLQTPHSLGFNDTIYHEGNISRLHEFISFLYLDLYVLGDDALIC